MSQNDEIQTNIAQPAVEGKQRLPSHEEEPSDNKIPTEGTISELTAPGTSGKREQSGTRNKQPKPQRCSRKRAVCPVGYTCSDMDEKEGNSKGKPYCKESYEREFHDSKSDV